MRTRLGPSGLVALVLVVSAACAGAGEPAASGPPRGVSSAVTAADTADETGDDAADGTVESTPATDLTVPDDTAARTALSGCNAAGAYEVCFSSPATHGGKDPAVVRHFIDIFKSAGAGDSLRIAMFRWDIPATTKAIVAAQQRGAHVEIVADADMTTKPAGKKVIAQIEGGDPMPGNVVVCKGACLPWTGKPPAPPSQDVNHLKYLLADIGGKKSVITSSSNFEGRQYSQVNSLTRVFDDSFYAFGLQYFQRLRAQSWTAGGVSWSDKQKSFGGPPNAMVYPRKRGDLVVDTLRSVHCAKGMNTVNIMIAVVQRYDVRTQIGRLAKEGCKLRIVTTRDLIENWLQSPFKLPDGRTVDIDNNRVRTIITHDKVYAIHAKIHGKERYVVVTGTSNTTCGGLRYNDEMMLRLDGKWLFKTYSAHVNDAFKHAHQSRVSAVPRQARCR
ncbi:phospholipase D-like domain-containing protein [Nocardioides halotolerans]|uniref:phospholipase D-like domain-containing protein n=1 Tax=Nocardioides halotolerans TaxID=433660 RepID=UPI00040E3435|nr:phospholipase D-like domain-containing protein [Nocardioides halotolerans]